MDTIGLDKEINRCYCLSRQLAKHHSNSLRHSSHLRHCNPGPSVQVVTSQWKPDTITEKDKKWTFTAETSKFSHVHDPEKKLALVAVTNITSLFVIALALCVSFSFSSLTPVTVVSMILASSLSSTTSRTCIHLPKQD
jgi:hypothetical protein